MYIIKLNVKSKDIYFKQCKDGMDMISYITFAPELHNAHRFKKVPSLKDIHNLFYGWKSFFMVTEDIFDSDLEDDILDFIADNRDKSIDEMIDLFKIEVLEIKLSVEVISSVKIKEPKEDK